MSCSRFHFVVIIVLFLEAVAHAELTVPDNLFTCDGAQVEQAVSGLLEQLGAEKLAMREAAQRNLADIGRRLKSAHGWHGRDVEQLDRYHTYFVVPVLAATENADFEVRIRARQILTQLRTNHAVGGGADGWLIYQLMDDIRFVLDPRSRDPQVREMLKSTSHIIVLDMQRRAATNVLFDAAVIKLARENPADTSKWILSHDFEDKNWLPHASRTIAVEHLMREWGATDFSAALRWCRALDAYEEPDWEPHANPPGRAPKRGVHRFAKNRLFQIAFRELVRHWPDDLPIDQATALVDLYPKNPDNRWASLACLRIAEHWVRRDAKAVIRWARTLPWENGKSLIYRHVFFDFARSDPKTAMTLLQEVPDGTEREAAAEYVVSGFVVDNREIGEILLASVSDEFRERLSNEDSLNELSSFLKRAHELSQRRHKYPYQSPKIVELLLARGPGDSAYHLKADEAAKLFETIWEYDDPFLAAASMNAEPPPEKTWGTWAWLLGHIWSHRNSCDAVRFVSRLRASEARALMIVSILQVNFELPAWF